MQHFICLDGKVRLRCNRKWMDVRNLRIRMQHKFGVKCCDTPTEFSWTVRLSDEQVSMILTPSELA